MNIALLYFSGTGSTYVVSKYLTSNLEKLSHKVDMLSIDDILRGKKHVDFKEYNMFGFVVPTYALGVPPNAFEIVDMLPRNREKVFIIRTGSVYSSINKSASVKLIRVLKKNWYSVFYDRLVVVSSNCLLDFEDELTKKLFEATVYGKIPKIAKDISSGRKRLYKRNYMRDILNDTVYFLYNKILRKMYGKSLYANKDCTHCKKCERNCPAKNISFSTGNFVAGDECLLCMRCVYECPVNAIHSRGLDFLAFRSGYNYFKIINNRKIGSKKFSVSKKMWKYIESDHK